MRSIYSLCASFLILCALLLSFSSAQAQSIGVASDYNMFLFGNHNQSNTDVEGRVAVGGNAQYGGLTIGSKIAPGGSIPSLVVGGNYQNQNNTVNGNAIIGGNANWQNPTLNGNLSARNVTLTGSGTINGKITYANNYSNAHTTVSGTVTKGAVTVPIDFAAARTYYTDLSTNLASLATTGSTSQAYGNLRLTGSGAGLEVFSLTTAQLASTNYFEFSSGFASNATILVNVSGTSASASNFGFNLGSANRQRILFNFDEANAVNLANIGWEGSVLAPKATVTANNGQFNGNLIAKNMNGSMEFHNTGYNGVLPSGATSVPEGGAGLFYLLGLPVIGLLVLRQRTA